MNDLTNAISVTFDTVTNVFELPHSLSNYSVMFTLIPVWSTNFYMDLNTSTWIENPDYLKFEKEHPHEINPYKRLIEK